MRPRDVPVLGAVFESGADDRVFDGLLLVGPLVILLVILLGRSVVTTTLASAYVAAFVLYVIYRAAT